MLLELKVIIEELPRLDFNVYTTRLTTQAITGSEFEPTLVGQVKLSINIAPLLNKLNLLTVRQGKMAMLTLGASTVAPV